MTEARTGLSGGSGPQNWNAAAYHIVSEPQFAWGLRVLERVSLGGVERVLDAGCGSGRLTKELAGRIPGARVVGCDLSANMARAAAATLGNVAGSDIVCADLISLPFRAEFDLVFSTATFHWVRDHDRLFAELRGVLRRGGRLEAQCGGGKNLARVHARADALASAPAFRAFFAKWEEPWHLTVPDETKARLLQAGFARADCWLEEAPTTFPDADRYREFVEAVVLRPYLAVISNPALRLRFLEALTTQASDDQPPFTLDYWRLNISAAL